MEDRKYQVELISRIYQAIKQGKKRIMVQLPTGGGKSVLFRRIINDVRKKAKTVMLIAHRRELIKQAKQHLIKSGISNYDISLLMGSEDYDPSLPVQVASIQTYVRRDPPDVDVIIVDEAHNTRSETYGKLFEHYSNKIIIGFTATPIRTNGKGFDDLYDELICGVGMQYLIENRYLSPYSIYSGKSIDTDGIKTVGGDWASDLLAEKSKEPQVVGDLVDHWLEHANGKRTVVFAINVEHAKLIVDEYRARGIRAEYIDSKGTSKAERSERIIGFIRGDYLVLVNINILTEGFDLSTYAEIENLPDADIACIQLARPTKSLSLYLQSVGRGLRLDRNNPHKVAIILDHAGNVDRHGLPNAMHRWSLQGVKKDESPTKNCPNCEAVIGQWDIQCPQCNYHFSPEEVDRIQKERASFELSQDLKGKLVEVDQTLVGQINRIQAKGAKDGRSTGWVRQRFMDLNPRLDEIVVFMTVMGFTSQKDRAATFYAYCNLEESKNREWVPDFPVVAKAFGLPEYGDYGVRAKWFSRQESNKAWADRGKTEVVLAKQEKISELSAAISERLLD